MVAPPFSVRVYNRVQSYTNFSKQHFFICTNSLQNGYKFITLFCKFITLGCKKHNKLYTVCNEKCKKCTKNADFIGGNRHYSFCRLLFCVDDQFGQPDPRCRGTVSGLIGADT